MIKIYLAGPLFTTEGLDWAQAIIANMDGFDPDSGTCGKCGLASLLPG